MNQRPKILYLQYNPNYGGKLLETLNELAPQYESLVVRTREKYVSNLHAFKPDLVLAEDGVTALTALAALKLVQGLSLDIPFILVTSQDDENKAITLLKAGAADYVINDKLWRLPYVLHNLLGKLRATKMMEHALLEKSRLYEQNLAGVFTANMYGKIRSCNAAFAAILGYESPQSLLGKEIGSMYFSAQERKESLQLLLEDGRVRNYESTFIKKDGSSIRVLINSYLLYDPVLGVEICEGVIIDYSATAQSLLNLDQSNAQLIKRNRNLEQFTYVISHNLRAPIANIISLTELLKGEDADSLNMQLINKLDSSIKTIDTIIKDVNHTLQNKNQLNNIREDVCFKQLMEEITSSINHLIKEENVEISYEFEVPVLSTIRGYLYSIFYNLTLNSIKYRRDDAHPVIRVKSVVEQEKLLLIFEDNGKGIDLEKNGNRLFDLYQRFDTTTDGKGMGLYMVKTQIEDLNGSIDIESELGKGTRILIRLPLVEA